MEVLVPERTSLPNRASVASNPLPRLTHQASNSMVTVRLSDVQIHPPLELNSETPEERHSDDSSESSRRSTATSDALTSPEDDAVDWEELEKTEEQEARDQGNDESTALLLARLDQENAALDDNPKAGLVRSSRPQTNTRPPSIQHLKNLVNGPQRESLRYSLLPAPPMTELEFWAALVSDYPQTVQRLPTLTANKLRGGVPPPLRGVVWPSIAGARDSTLHAEFQKLCQETSPYEGLIGKDVGRSFPNVDMFRETGGEGQQMLGRVLKCFSLHDQKIGYCQGLGFVVGPLLMHMSDVEAFCVIVRLMEHYDLRSCYLPDLAGLHLRIYQFQKLLSRHLPDLATHLEALKVEPLYVSQWFLSFFAVTCPLPMLLRIYDVILSEGATETLMRVALSLMGRNEKKIMAFTEFEDIMQFLLSRGLWDTYALHADDLVTDFTSLTGLVSRESLQNLESGFRECQSILTLPSLKNTAAQFLGRFWAGSSHAYSKSGNNLTIVLPSRPESTLRRPSSKQSLTSTVNSLESISEAGTSTTDASLRSSAVIVEAEVKPVMNNNKDKDLHGQIEDLLTAMGNLQKQQADLARDLQREREERDEDRSLAVRLLESLKPHASAVRELVGGEPDSDEVQTQDLISTATARFSAPEGRRISIIQSKHQLRDAASEWKAKHDLAAARCQELMTQLDARELEHNTMKAELRDARARIQDSHREKERLERTVQDLRRGRGSPVPESPTDCYTPISETPTPTTRSGLREFKLGRVNSLKSTNPTATTTTTSSPAPSSTSTLPVPAPPSSSTSPTAFGRRTSSLGLQSVLAAIPDHAPAELDALLLELVAAKTAEAVARQELDEVKAKLDTLRKMLGVGSSPIAAAAGARGERRGSTTSPSQGGKSPAESPRGPVGGGFFSGWGKKSIV